MSTTSVGILVFSVVVLVAGCAGSAEREAASPRPLQTPAPAPEALSACGRYRLRIERIEQKPSPWDENVSAVSIGARFEFMDPKHPTKPLYTRVSDIFLDSKLTLKRVLTAEGVDCARNKCFAYANNYPRWVTISDLGVGSERTALKLVELAVPVVKIEKWKTLEFKSLGKAKSGFLHCGPFELVTEGEDKRFRVAAGAFVEFSDRHERFRKEVPLQFLHHQYAVNEVVIVDSSGQRLSPQGGCSTGGGSSYSFVIPDWSKTKPLVVGGKDIPLTTGRMAAGHKDIAYPVTVSIRIPEKWTTEMVTFSFTDVELPTRAEGRWEIGQRWTWPSSKSAAGSKKPGASSKSSH